MTIQLCILSTLSLSLRKLNSRMETSLQKSLRRAGGRGARPILKYLHHPSPLSTIYYKLASILIISFLFLQSNRTIKTLDLTQGPTKRWGWRIRAWNLGGNKWRRLIYHTTIKNEERSRDCLPTGATLAALGRLYAGKINARENFYIRYISLPFCFLPPSSSSSSPFVFCS